MTLSPFEVERREFGRTPFGYKQREVDAFVDEVHRSLGQLWQERSDTREDNERLKERLTRFEQLEEQLKNTLLLAQDSAEKAHEQARRESDLVMREAGQKARDIVHQAHEDKQRVEMVLRDLTSAEQEARQRLRALSSAIVSHLDDTEQLVADGAAKMRATVQAQPETTEATLRPSVPEEITISSAAAERAVQDAELVATTAPERNEFFTEPMVNDLAPESTAVDALGTNVAASKTADAFFDSPPAFDPSDFADRTPRSETERTSS